MHKYVALMNELEDMIEDKSFQEGDRLPSIRELSVRFKVSKSTVIRAFSELERQHLIYSVPKSGYYVVKKTNQRPNPGKAVIDFSASAPDPDVFPYIDFQHCINKAIDTYKNDLFIYGTPKGLPSLIEAIQKSLPTARCLRKRNTFLLHQACSRPSLCSLQCLFPTGSGKF